MKAFLIDSIAREIREVEYTALEQMQSFVGGYIGLVPTRCIGRGDVLFVDDDGLNKPQAGWFMLADYPQPLAGNGLIVGAEQEDDEGEYARTSDPVSTIAGLTQVIRFLTREQAASWGKANASEPCISFTSIGPDGRFTETVVVSRMGTVFAEATKPDPEDR
jgi:hypothetical protein